MFEPSQPIPLENDNNPQVLPYYTTTVRLWPEDLNQHLKDFLKLVDSLDLNGDNREEHAYVYFNFSFAVKLEIGLNVFQQDPSQHGRILLLVSLPNSFHREGLQNSATISRCSNNIKENLFLKHGLVSRIYSKRKLSTENAWATIEKLAQYEDGGWNDPVIPEEGNLEYENPDIEHLLGVMKYKVDTPMKNALSLMGGSESIFRMTSNETYRLPLKPSRQEEFEHIMTNFILDQEERVWQLEEYMKVIVGDFMQLSSEVIRRLKEKLREEVSRIGEQEVNPLPPKKYHWRKRFEGSGHLKMVCTICTMMLLLDAVFTPGTSLIGKFLASQGLDQAFFESINKDPFSSPQWVNLFQINENVYRELVREFFASFEFDASPFRYDPNQLGVRFRLRGEQREISLLELGWRVNLFSKRQSRESTTLSGLRKGVTVKVNHLLLGFWPTIGDGGFNMGNTKVTAIKDPKVKLGHRCIATTIAGRKKSTHRVIEIDLFYLYCIYPEGVVCNITYWLAKLLTNEIMGALSVKPSLHVFKKKSLISIGVVMELHNGAYFWPATREVEEENEEDEEANEATRGDAGNEGARGFANMYRNMSQDPYLQIDPFPEREADYPPYGYTDHMPPGYEYRFGPAPGGSELYLTRRSLEVLRKFHWTTLGGRSNRLSHVSSPLLSKPGEYLALRVSDYSSSLAVYFANRLKGPKIMKARASSDKVGSSRGDTENVGGAVALNVQGCSHKTFTNGKPHPFNGTEGVVGLSRWIEKVHHVFEISKCAKGDKVMLAASTFEGHALTWWNGNVHTLGLVNANMIPWNEFKEDDLEIPIIVSHELALMCPELVLNEKKRVERICGEKGHYKNRFPKGRNHQNEGAPARAYVMGIENPQQNPNVVTGTFLLNDHYASILFDSGAEKSFVSTEFSPFINIAPATLDTSYEVELADGKIVSTNTVLRGSVL
ncbi:hypothetical protein Tco_0449341 [Tanacetum coccineum]